jgi:hypothetical protein
LGSGLFLLAHYGRWPVVFRNIRRTTNFENLPKKRSGRDTNQIRIGVACVLMEARLAFSLPEVILILPSNRPFPGGF